MRGNRLVHLVGSLLAIIALIYFGRTLAHYWTQSAGDLSRPAVAIAACCAVLLGVVGYFASAAAWLQLCKAMGMDIGQLLALRIYFISQFGKYLPGNVAQHLGRLAMCVQERHPGSVVATSQIVELLMITGLLSIIAVMVGPSYLMGWELDLARIGPWHIALAAVALICGAVLTVSLLRHWTQLRSFADLLRGRIASRQGIVHFVSATTLILGNLGVTTLGLYFIATAVSGLHSLSLVGIGGVFTVSWLAGFATPGAPAGFGVRETVMFSLLSQNMPVSDAVTVSLVFRVATTATDLTVLGLGLCLRPERSGNIAIH